MDQYFSNDGKEQERKRKGHILKIRRKTKIMQPDPRGILLRWAVGEHVKHSSWLNPSASKQLYGSFCSIKVLRDILHVMHMIVICTRLEFTTKASEAANTSLSKLITDHCMSFSSYTSPQ